MNYRCTCETAHCTGRGCLFDGDPTLVPDYLVEQPEQGRRVPMAILCVVAGALLVATLGFVKL